jgi:hypothetical protein
MSSDETTRKAPRCRWRNSLAVAIVPVLAFVVVGLFFLFRDGNDRQREPEAGDADRVASTTEKPATILLSIDGTRFTDADLASLADREKIGSLRMSGTPITDAGLTHLKDATNLRQLWLDGTAIGDEGVAALTELKQLSCLALDRTQVTDAGLESLGVLGNLRFLLLDETRVSDAGLVNLRRLENLCCLSTAGTNVTSGGLDELKKSLPKLGAREAADLRAARDRARPRSRPDGALTVVDDDVMEAVLNNLLDVPDLPMDIYCLSLGPDRSAVPAIRPWPSRSDPPPRICRINPKAAPWRHDLSQILNERSESPWDLTKAERSAVREGAEHLVGRNQNRDSLETFQVCGPRIQIHQKGNAATAFDRPINLWAPGYSHDGRIAVVSVHIPMADHGADGTFVLTVVDGNWAVRLRQFRYYQ